MIEFRKITDYPRGTLYSQLEDAYSFNSQCHEQWAQSWKEYDDFFYDHSDIAENYGFITVLDGIPIGHLSWDPRNKPEYAIIGHNCILTKYKGNGYGKKQLEEALRRIKAEHFKKIVVTTNEITVSAQKNYESVGMKRVATRMNPETPFAGNYIDYELVL